jgi:SsrA-binding protein
MSPNSKGAGVVRHPAPDKTVKKLKPRKTVSENRRARHDYMIEDVFEAGLVLVGSEVKSLRVGRATIAEAYVSPEAEGLTLINAHIPEYHGANRANHEPKRPRKLLLHKREIDKLAGAVQRKGLTIIPLKLFFDERGRAKIEIALARGKHAHDKRESEKTRSWERDKARLMREKG